jgi:hypothetical protein
MTTDLTTVFGYKVLERSLEQLQEATYLVLYYYVIIGWSLSLGKVGL